MEKILVLDFGGQYNQLIARRVRDHGVFAEILPYTTSLDTIRQGNYKGIIFTGGPNSVYDPASPHYTPEVLELGVPVLGICYGCQLMAWMLGGKVETAPVSEYGKIKLTVLGGSVLRDVPQDSTVWMSHTDYIAQPPAGFTVTGKTADCPCAAMENPERGLYAVQFHPEVTHTTYGKEMLHHFLFDVCGCSGDWQMDNFIEKTVAALRAQIGDKKVILGLSGGVDSSVAAGLLSRAVGKQLTCVFVDQGLMRKDEGDFVEETFTRLFGGGHAELKLMDPDDPLNCGIEVVVQPPGKKLQMLSLLSGGEQAFVAIALYFAILEVNPAPFCIMDEIEAALDEVNVDKFADYVKRYSEKTQFVLITHRRGTMEAAERLYGVTMHEKGISDIISVDVSEIEHRAGKLLE